MEWLINYFPNYSILIEFGSINDGRKKQEVNNLIELENTRCLFCGKVYKKGKKKDVAHAISECLGNKKLINYRECYECNHLFGEILENHLGKFIMPYRFVCRIFGKRNKNIIRDNPKDKDMVYENYIFEQSNTQIFEDSNFDVSTLIIENTLSKRVQISEDGMMLDIPRQIYDPRMVYASFLKMAYVLLPPEEISKYSEVIKMLYFFVKAKSDNKYTEKVDAFFNFLPSIGVEILDNNYSSEGVNVCLLKLMDDNLNSPAILFAIQMKMYTIVVPIFDDDDIRFKKNRKLKFEGTDNVRMLDFTKFEENFKCYLQAEKKELNEKVIKYIEQLLRKNKHLKQ